ncbi:MAG: carotenoid biosynthesis protein [Lachnospirales bacterium]
MSKKDSNFICGKNNVITYIKWICIISYIILLCLKKLSLTNIPIDILSILNFVPLILFGWIHGIQRYGVKNMVIWFVITFIVSNFFEGFSIAYGFPFGNYHYSIVGFRIWNVPISIMPTYFGIAYTSWTVAQAAISKFNSKFNGLYKFIVPISSAIVMTMYDLVQDPIASTLQGQWIWEDGGAYFGVPISNFFGWVFVVYIFMQIYTLFISNQEISVKNKVIDSHKGFWIEPIIMYFAMGMGFVLEALICKENTTIITSMGMISVFTMIFVSVIAFINVKNSKELD